MLCFVFYCFCVSLVWASPLTSSSKNIGLKDIGSRIFNGDDAALGQFPYEVAISVNNIAEFCAGAIISEYYVLTAGHCVSGASLAHVRTGFVSFESNPRSYFSEQLILHEDFFFNSTVLVNDIGLIKLALPIKFDNNTKPISLASRPLEAGVEVTVGGWGITEYGGTTVSFDLKYITLTTIENSDCADTLGKLIIPTVVCAVAESEVNRSPCRGDSGAPLVTNPDTTPLHVGLASFTTPEGCGMFSPSGYTRTASYLEWIKANSDVV